MAVEKRRRLKQGDAKNAFCQGVLPDDEMTIIKPPPGDPDADKDEFWLLKKTLYGLCRSPRHWFDLISSTLRSIGFTPSVHDPCLWVGTPSSPDCPANQANASPNRQSPPSPECPTNNVNASHKDDAPLYVGLYVDDFVYFSEDDDVEKRFERLLGDRIKCDFMGTVNWFLGTHFEWADHADGALSVHLSQAAYAQNIVERLKLDDSNFNPKATPYRSGCPIDSIPPATIDENDPYFVRRRESYRSLVGNLTWLATNTRPDLAPATFSLHLTTAVLVLNIGRRPNMWHAMFDPLPLMVLHFIHLLLTIHRLTFTSHFHMILKLTATLSSHQRIVCMNSVHSLMLAGEVNWGTSYRMEKKLICGSFAQ